MWFVTSFFQKRCPILLWDAIPYPDNTNYLKYRSEMLLIDCEILAFWFGYLLTGSQKQNSYKYRRYDYFRFFDTLFNLNCFCYFSKMGNPSDQYVCKAFWLTQNLLRYFRKYAPLPDTYPGKASHEKILYNVILFFAIPFSIKSF